MRKLVLNQTGGHKLTLNDADFIDGKINELADALASHGYLCILSGCVLWQNVGSGTWHITAGYAILFGGVFEVQAGDTGLANATEPTTNTYFQVIETVASPSPVTYKNLAVRNVHYTRKAVVNTTAFGGSQYSAVPMYEDVMANKLSGAILASRIDVDALGLRLRNIWHTVGDSGEPGLIGGWVVGTSSIKFTKDKMDNVSIIGQAGNNHYTSGPIDNIFILPVGYRPTQHFVFSTQEQIMGGWCQVAISAAGIVTFFAQGKVDEPVAARFDGIANFRNY